MPEDITKHPSSTKHLPDGQQRQLVSAIFEHSQGDPRDTEILLVDGISMQYPNWRLPSIRRFLRILEEPMTILTGREERHTPVKDPKDIPGSLKRVYERLYGATERMRRDRVLGKDISLDQLVPELTRQIICRDWLYLVHDNGRPKPGIQPGELYDPNEDKWFSYIAYYALWKDSNGNRHPAGSDFFNLLYRKIGDYLEHSLDDLGVDESYKDRHGNPDGQAIEDKLMEALRVYNKQQRILGRTNQYVWKERIDEYFSGEDEIEVVLQ